MIDLSRTPEAPGPEPVVNYDSMSQFELRNAITDLDRELNGIDSQPEFVGSDVEGPDSLYSKKLALRSDLAKRVEGTEVLPYIPTNIMPGEK